MARSRKFSSKKVVDDKYGQFDSTTEYKYWLYLVDLQEKGIITNLDRQREFLLVPSFKDSYGKTVRKMVYKSDMTYEKDGQLVIVDCKGTLYNITIESKNKIKMCKYLNQDARFELIVTLEGKWYNLEDKEQKKEYTELQKVKKNKRKKKKVDK